MARALTVSQSTILAPLYAPGTAAWVSPSLPGGRGNARGPRLEHLHPDLGSGTIQLALLYHLDITGNICRFLLGEVILYALLPEADPLAARQAVSARDLARHPFVLTDLPGSRNAFLSIFKASGVTLPEITVASRSRWSLSWWRAGRA